MAAQRSVKTNPFLRPSLLAFLLFFQNIPGPAYSATLVTTYCPDPMDLPRTIFYHTYLLSLSPTTSSICAVSAFEAHGMLCQSHAVHIYPYTDPPPIPLAASSVEYMHASPPLFSYFSCGFCCDFWVANLKTKGRQHVRAYRIAVAGRPP